jgi:hypothetical protein
MEWRGRRMTNGDKIRQMSNEELAKFGADFPCKICANDNCCDFLCIEGIKAYLDMEVQE